MPRFITLLFFASLLSGCATSKVTAFRDPAFATKSFSSIVVFAQGMALDAAVEVEKQVCEKINPTPCTMGKTVLPPTRQYSAEEAEDYLLKSGAEGVLFIALVADQSSTQYFGTITNSSAYGSANTIGTVNFFQNSAFWSANTRSSVSSQSTTTPIYGYSRVAYGQLGLFDRASGDIAWRGEIKIEGQGALNVTDNVFIGSATSKISKELRSSKLIR